MKGVALVSSKGGTGKTSLSHLLALGAAWNNVPSYLMHTDARDPIQVQGRPYLYYDARKPETLATLVEAAINQDGLCIIDGGGNRPDFDNWIANAMDLVLLPVTPDQESTALAISDRERMLSAGASDCRFILNNVSSNANARAFDQAAFYDLLDPDLIIGEIKSVSAIKRLSMPDKEPFTTPPSNLNKLSRSFYQLIKSAV